MPNGPVTSAIPTRLRLPSWLAITFSVGGCASGPPVDPDSDHDGITGFWDQCPHAAERPTRDGRVSNPDDGCPDDDRDGDGVSDDEDRCPLWEASPRWPVGSPLYGCPENVAVCEQVPWAGDDLGYLVGCPDRDEDGVPDGFDDCPDEPRAPVDPRVDRGCSPAAVAARNEAMRHPAPTSSTPAPPQAPSEPVSLSWTACSGAGRLAYTPPSGWTARGDAGQLVFEPTPDSGLTARVTIWAPTPGQLVELSAAFRAEGCRDDREPEPVIPGVDVPWSAHACVERDASGEPEAVVVHEVAEPWPGCGLVISLRASNEKGLDATAPVMDALQYAP